MNVMVWLAHFSRRDYLLLWHEHMLTSLLRCNEQLSFFVLVIVYQSIYQIWVIEVLNIAFGS